MLSAKRVDDCYRSIPDPPHLAQVYKKLRRVVRATFFSFSFGLISVSVLAGCSLFDKGSCDKCNNGGPVRKRLAYNWPNKKDATAKVKLTVPANQADIVQTNATEEPSIAAVPGQVTSGLPYKVDYIPAASSDTPAQKVVNANIRPSANASMDPNQEQNIVLKNVSFKYGHGVNFESVTGQVQTFRKTVRLRYASIEQEDPYGGAVILEGAEVGQLRDGQHVRVQGVFVAPTDRNGSAKYRVRSIEVLD